MFVQFTLEDLSFHHVYISYKLSNKNSISFETKLWNRSSNWKKCNHDKSCYKYGCGTLALSI